MKKDGILTVRPNPAEYLVRTQTKDNAKISVPGLPPNYKIEMAWHHVIPWNTLRDGWNALVAKKRWEPLSAWLMALDRNTTQDEDKILNAIKGSRLDDPSCLALEKAVCWASWNIVEGPAHRSDDPGEKFDEFKSSRLSGQKRYRFNLLKRVNDSLELIETYSDRRIANEFGELRAYKSAPPLAFDPALWEVVTRGKLTSSGQTVSIDHAVNSEAHPVWRKAAD